MNTKSNREMNIVSNPADREITIGQLADSITQNTGFRCTPGMINNYEKLGLVRHSSRTEGGARRFKITDIQVISRIKRWQSEGMSLDQIKTRLAEDKDLSPNDEELTYLPEDKKIRILEASARIFPNKGYEATTMQEIAAEADISPSMIYQFYRSKEDLFLSFTENTAYSQILEVMTETLDDKKIYKYEEIRQVLFDVANNFVIWHVKRLEHIRLLVSTSRTFPSIGKHYREKLINPTERLLAQFFEHLNVQGQYSVTDPVWASRVFFCIFADMALSWNWFSGNVDPVFPGKAEIFAAIDIFLAGIFRSRHQG